MIGILLFHSQDEAALASWQSGVYYADGTPKTSLYAVRDALARARGGSIARCDGLGLDVTATKLRFPDPGRAPARVARTVRFTLLARLRVGAARVGRHDTAPPRARTTGYGRAGVSDHRLAEGPQARNRVDPVLAHADAPGQPGRPADARERDAQPPLRYALAT